MPASTTWTMEHAGIINVRHGVASIINVRHGVAGLLCAESLLLLLPASSAQSLSSLLHFLENKVERHFLTFLHFLEIYDRNGGKTRPCGA